MSRQFGNAVQDRRAEVAGKSNTRGSQVGHDRPSFGKDLNSANYSNLIDGLQELRRLQARHEELTQGQVKNALDDMFERGLLVRPAGKAGPLSNSDVESMLSGRINQIGRILAKQGLDWQSLRF